MTQLAANPWLEVLLQQLDRCEYLVTAHAAAADHHTVAPMKVSPDLLERYFILLLLLPQLSGARGKSLETASPYSWSAQAASHILQEPTTTQSALSGSPLALALAPIRQLVRDNQPHASLLPFSPPLHADLAIPNTAHLTAVLGPSVLASLHSALSSAPSAASSASAPSLSLHLSPSIPRFAPPPLVDVHWESLGSEFGAEVSWMNWDPPADLNWDVQPIAMSVPSSPSNSCALTPTSMSTPLAQLLSKALKSQLLAGERAQLLQELKANSTAQSTSLEASLTLSTAISLIPPSRLPQLVEKNHEVAREFILQFMTISLHRATAVSSTATPPLPHTINDYLSPLVDMDMSLHSMELVKDLALVDQIALPADFLHLYICKCLASCSNLADKFLQNRHVRLICVFLQALMRHKIIQLPTMTTTTTTHVDIASASSSATLPSTTVIGDVGRLQSVRDVLLVEVQSFLVEFSRIREAANLYKIIKQLEATAT
jgi:hypothetical protein